VSLISLTLKSHKGSYAYPTLTPPWGSYAYPTLTPPWGSYAYPTLTPPWGSYAYPTLTPPWLLLCAKNNTGCARRTTPLYMWREQAIIEWSWHVKSIVACCHSAKLCAHAARDFRSQQYVSLNSFGIFVRNRVSCAGGPNVVC